jgi:AcrR family transcriptional regulator
MARPRSDIAPRVLQAARRRFLEHGVDGASLRKIAEDAETNIGMIYYYFPTKEALFDAVVTHAYGVVLRDIEAALDPEASVAECLRRLSIRIGSLSDEEFDVMRIVLKEALVSTERLGGLVRRFSAGHVPIVLATLRRGVVSGELSERVPLPILAAAAAGILLVPQFVRRRLAGSVPALANMLPAPDRLAAMLLSILLDGIRGPKSVKGEA